MESVGCQRFIWKTVTLTVENNWQKGSLVEWFDLDHGFQKRTA